MILTADRYDSIESIRAEITTDNGCVILGNGSSLNRLNFDLIGQYFTIGVNRIGRIFTPDVHCKLDNYPFETDSPAKVSGKIYKMDGYIRTAYKHPSIVLALWVGFDLGFRTFYLCGADFKGDHFWGADPNKFQHNPRYHKDITSSQIHRIKFFESITNELGGTVYNCSDDSVIDFLEYTDLFYKE